MTSSRHLKTQNLLHLFSSLCLVLRLRRGRSQQYWQSVNKQFPTLIRDLTNKFDEIYLYFVVLGLTVISNSPAMDEDSKTDKSRSGRVRKRPKNLADFETQDNIDEDNTVKVNQNSNKTTKNVSLKCQISLVTSSLKFSKS